MSESSTNQVVRCDGLSKRYGEVQALADCSLHVRQGEIFGLLGPNGAGKTTLIRLLLGYLHPTSGHCEVVGSDPAFDSVAVRRQVSYLPGDARLPRHMKGHGLLKFFASIHPQGDLERALEVADRLELDLSRRVAFMSTGMRQKLALAVVFGPNTPLLILDEPTANLDPTVRENVLQLVLSAREQGRTIVFSSHVLSEIEQTCDRVCFLRRGHLAHELVMHDLFQRHRITASRTDKTETASSVAPLSIPDPLKSRVHSIQETNGRVQIDTSGDLAATLPWVTELPLESIRIEPLGLHTVYQSVHRGETVSPAQATDANSDISAAATPGGAS